MFGWQQRQWALAPSGSFDNRRQYNAIYLCPISGASRASQLRLPAAGLPRRAPLAARRRGRQRAAGASRAPDELRHKTRQRSARLSPDQHRLSARVGIDARRKAFEMRHGPPLATREGSMCPSDRGRFAGKGSSLPADACLAPRPVAPVRASLPGRYNFGAASITKE